MDTQNNVHSAALYYRNRDLLRVGNMRFTVRFVHIVKYKATFPAECYTL